MAYELFLGQLPFTAETAAEVMVMHLRAAPPPPSELWPNIPLQLEALLLAMLAKAPDERPTMAEVADRLELVRAALGHPRTTGAGDAVDIPAEPVRRRISVGCRAATEPAIEIRQRSPRWQYAVGGLALVATAVLFLIARSGDQGAALAAPPAAALTHEAPAPAHAPSATAPTADAPAAPTSASLALSTPSTPTVVADSGASSATATSEIAADHTSTSPAAAQRPPHADSPHPRAPGVRTRVGTSSNRRGNAVPRPSKKIDPNGTIDVFR
jgi:serine/threonine-protein kinase